MRHLRHPFGVRPLGALLLASAAALTLSPALRAQGNLPTVRHSAPAVRAPGRTTKVDLDFTVPRGFRLARNPRLRVIDAKGELYELLPTFISQPTPVGKGHRGLHTGNYRPGTYLVRAELDYLDARGREGTIVSPWATLTVPAR